MTLPTTTTLNGCDDDSDMFGPPRSSPPIGYRSRVPMISPKLRQREERKRILQLCAHKLERIKDSETNLRRSVCINNTYCRLTDELRREKQSRYLANLPKSEIVPETARDNIFNPYNSCGIDSSNHQPSNKNTSNNNNNNNNENACNNQNIMNESTTLDEDDHIDVVDDIDIYPQQASYCNNNSQTQTAINDNNNNNIHNSCHASSDCITSCCNSSNNNDNNNNNAFTTSSNSTNTITTTTTSSSSSSSLSVSANNNNNNNNNNTQLSSSMMNSSKRHHSLSSSNLDNDLEILDRELNAINASPLLIDPEITQGAEQLEKALLSSTRKRARAEDESDRLVREALSQFYIPPQRFISAIEDCPLDLVTGVNGGLNMNGGLMRHEWHMGSLSSLGVTSSPTKRAKLDYEANIPSYNNNIHNHINNNNHNNINNNVGLSDLELDFDMNPNQKDFEVIMDALRLGTPSPTPSNDSCGQAAMMLSESASVFHNLVVTSLET